MICHFSSDPFDKDREISISTNQFLIRFENTPTNPAPFVLFSCVCVQINFNLSMQINLESSECMIESVKYRENVSNVGDVTRLFFVFY